jgi:hypothetical protein
MAEYTLDLTINHSHKVTLSVDYQPSEPESGYNGYCDVEVMSCDEPLVMINDLLGDALRNKVFNMLELELTNETRNITVGHL